MAFSVEIIQQVRVPSGLVAKSTTYSASSVTEVNEAVANSQTDFEIVVAIDVSAVKAFYLVSDQDVTIETNDGSSADDTIALVSNVPYVWTEDSYDAFLLGTDVTSLFVTNASGASATIDLKVAQDATP